MKIVIHDPLGIDDEYLEMIRQAAGDDTVLVASKEDLAGELVDAEVFFGFHSPEVFAGAAGLKWIQTTAAGIEKILVPELTERGLLLTNASGIHAPPVVEMAWALTLAVGRNMKRFHRQQQEHHWEFTEPFDVNGRTVGIIGLGGIGRRYARVAVAFGMRVIAVDLHHPPQPDDVESLWPLDRLNDLIAESDVVLVSCPATRETQGLVGAEQLALMKPDAILVNIARGGIVDEPALIECLTEGRIAGAGLDVTATEPLPADSPLWDTPDLVITPHCAGLSRDRVKHLVEFFCENLGRYKAGEPLQNLVDQDKGYPVPGE